MADESIGEATESSKCDHGATFDPAEASRMLREWTPSTAVAFICGNPSSAKALIDAAVAYAAARKAWQEAETPFKGIVGSAYTTEYAAAVTPRWEATKQAEARLVSAGLAFGRGRLRSRRGKVTL